MMKNIINYINDSFEVNCLREKRMQEINEFYDNNVPEDILTHINDINFDYVLENLKTYSADTIINKLKSNFNRYKFSKVLSYGTTTAIIQIEGDMDLLDNETFNHIIQFYNYTVTYTNENKNLIYLESKLGEVATDYIYNDCKGICYHLSRKRNTTSILKNGFRCKAKSIQNGDYRNFDERTFLYASNKSIDDIMKDLKQYAETIFHSSLSNFDILKINLNKIKNSNITIYKDPAMGIDTAFYCTTNIPNKCVTIV